MIAQHEINFSKFVQKWTLEGSREVFEQFVFEFLRIKFKYHNNINKIRRNPGDWGIDIICGDFSDFNIIWQCKFFPEKIDRVQQAEIRNSYNSAIKMSKEKKFKILKWILCIPINFAANELKWWEGWKKKMEKRDTLTIESITLSIFKEKHSDNRFQDLLHSYFQEGEKTEPLPSVNIEDLENYEDLIFLKNIKNSDISSDIINLKRNYYFADYFENNIDQKESKNEILQLETIYIELFNLWETIHIDIYNKRENDDGNELFNEIRKYLQNNLRNFSSRFYNINIPILIGLVLKLSDRNIVYWTRNRIDY